MGYMQPFRGWAVARDLWQLHTGGGGGVLAAAAAAGVVQVALSLCWDAREAVRRWRLSLRDCLASEVCSRHGPQVEAPGSELCVSGGEGVKA